MRRALTIALTFLILLWTALFWFEDNAGAQSTLPTHWAGNTLLVEVPQSGCLMAMPGDTGTAQCNFSGAPWVAVIPRYGDQFVAASVPGRWYELESGGVRVARAEVPPLPPSRFAVYFPIVAKE